ncbi:unnamed protein product [Protopolystoma xenopodis]|uniref:Uncharacterized protein n=1 Tax=Protopolystoma xenopodis TaxID=117903 RepID=A0A448XH90_9PLAT|nr:unnamed protein product [Protopolystoma xenopodis]
MIVTKLRYWFYSFLVRLFILKFFLFFALSHYPVSQSQFYTGHTDGESIYSYFSQQEICSPGPQHQHLNPLPEEHQLAGFSEAFSQTLDPALPTGSPNGPSQHDQMAGLVGGGGKPHHHRRRRRKQPHGGTPTGTGLGTPGDNGAGASPGQDQTNSLLVPDQTSVVGNEEQRSGVICLGQMSGGQPGFVETRSGQQEQHIDQA